MNIAIDGPAGAGKSTIAKMVAKDLGSIYVDTGAMYRAVALRMLKLGVDTSDTVAITNATPGMDITIRYADGVQHVILDGEDVSDKIRTNEVSGLASVVAAVPAVRKKLVELQQKLASETSVVMDGRDIGTVVLPNAELKIYLTASQEERARRRFRQNEEQGTPNPPMDMLVCEIAERDRRDMTRPVSPLRKAEDAVLLDSSDMTIEEVVARILSLAKERENVG
ncbi:MAG: (d)CMP kinase [Lachnospiraceae bacterium]